MSENICYPTQGELVTYIFNAFGILPTKHEGESGFDEKAKTTFQRLLKRLKDEDGLLIKNLEKAIGTFDERLGQFLPDDRARKIIMGVLSDLYWTYNRMMINEGTCYSKSDTLLHFLVAKATSGLVESVTFHSLRQRLFVGVDLVSDLELCLPDISSADDIIWPMAKVIRWIYSEADRPQIQFHFPGKVVGSSDYRMDHNLENAGNWVRDEAIPSLPALIANFTESLAALDNSQEISENLKSTMELRLTLARLSTTVCKDIVEAYGTSGLRKFLTNLRTFFRDICIEIDEFKRVTAKAHQVNDLAKIPDWLWQDACSHYEIFFFGKKEKALAKLHALYHADPKYLFKQPDVEALAGTLGRYPVMTNLYILVVSGTWAPSLEIMEFLKRGHNLKKDPSTSLDDVAQLEKALDASDLADQLAWLTPWLQSVCFYRASQFEKAWPFSKTAFTMGKYRAGGNQYLLVNQFLELCAKTKRWREFKAAYEWANYARIRVRWSGEGPPSKENMESAYTILGMQGLTYTEV